MNILLLGSGGREHALAWKITQSKNCTHLFIAPGNTGTAAHGTNVEVDVNDFEAQKKIVLDHNIQLVVVGPEEPLVKGVYNFYQQDDLLKHVKVIGPSANAAQLEGSKAFSKKFMQRQQIPTAAYAEFTATEFEHGKKYIQEQNLPIVLKADGLAAGKGVVIAQSYTEALTVFEEMLIHKQFGDASTRVVIEEFLTGIEVSVFVLTDGIDYKIIGHAKDYKRIGEGDTGLNTGGMGCVSPVPFVNDVFMQKVEERIIKPTIAGLQKEQLEYKGFVFFGLIKVDDEPYVIEYNCRLGDPETEVILPRLQNDLVDLFLAVHNGGLSNTEIHIDTKAYATVVAVSGGYPGKYAKGKLITGLDTSFNDGTTTVFHAGTIQTSEGIVTNGGRVLAVTSSSDDITKAVQLSTIRLSHIHFDGMNFRKDIGFEFA